MAETKTIKTVELVRRIRDEQAASLAGKSDSQVIEFFRRHGELVRQDAKKAAGGRTSDSDDAYRPPE